MCHVSCVQYFAPNLAFLALTPVCTRMYTSTHVYTQTCAKAALEQDLELSSVCCSLVSLGTPRFGLGFMFTCQFLLGFPEPPANMWVPVSLWHQLC